MAARRQRSVAARRGAPAAHRPSPRARSRWNAAPRSHAERFVHPAFSLAKIPEADWPMSEARRNVSSARLYVAVGLARTQHGEQDERTIDISTRDDGDSAGADSRPPIGTSRSEERRVGKQCSYGL